MCNISSFSFIPISSRATSTTRSSSISATATKRFRNQYNNSNIMHNYKRSPLPIMLILRTKFTNSSQKMLQQNVINSSKATTTETTTIIRQQQQANNQRKKRHLRLLLTATATTLTFFTINAFGTYTHYHDDLFIKYYPLPFALDVGIGYSMIPTINPINNNLYLRDTRRGIIYNKGDIVTIYNPYTKNIVTKRIVGVEGDEICLYGEFAMEFSKLQQQHQLQKQ